MSQESPVPDNRLMNPPSTPPQSNHGRTVAGWFLFWATCVGVVVIAVGAILFNKVTIGVGAGVVALGLVISIALRVMGLGQPTSKRDAPTVEDLQN